MRKRIEFENIEELRRQVGIDDAELRAAIGKLQPGDVVNLTLASRQATLISVRITRIRRAEFRARLVCKLSSRAAKPAETQFVTFAACHIHSIARPRQLKPARDESEIRLLPAAEEYLSPDRVRRVHEHRAIHAKGKL